MTTLSKQLSDKTEFQQMKQSRPAAPRGASSVTP